MMIDPHYQPTMVGLPTSATRGSWQPPPPPPWIDGMYHVPPGYYTSPYYRPPPGMIPHTQGKHEFVIHGSSTGTAGASSSTSGESSHKTQVEFDKTRFVDFQRLKMCCRSSLEEKSLRDRPLHRHQSSTLRWIENRKESLALEHQIQNQCP